MKADIIRQQRFISGKFHKCLSRFMNVALWKHEEIYRKAYKRALDR